MGRLYHGGTSADDRARQVCSPMVVCEFTCQRMPMAPYPGEIMQCRVEGEEPGALATPESVSVNIEIEHSALEEGRIILA